VMPNLNRALLVAAALGCTALAGCTSTEDRKSETAAAKSETTATQKKSDAAPEQAAQEVLNDSVVTAKVKAKLVDDPVTKAYQINVETFKGTVQLSGFVDSAEAVSRATQLAKDVGGVKNVKNSLQVRKSDG
jgi:osmotically-inducible protein OsmY